MANNGLKKKFPLTCNGLKTADKWFIQIKQDPQNAGIKSEDLNDHNKFGATTLGYKGF